jgi:formylglycine-generating enzyme required for sulfatase activity
MEMKLIPAGTFVMGSPRDEMARREDEVQHEVTISRPFYMAAHECRQREFYRLMMPEDYDYGAWKYERGPLQDGAAWRHKWHGGGFGAGDLEQYTYPMECVSWYGAKEFCDKLTEREKKAARLPGGYVYRLPTEAEWEYACRAESRGPFHFKADYGKCYELSKYVYLGGGGWTKFGAGDTDSKRRPNAWGLYDMHGNVYEWCLDWYGPYEKDAQTDPPGPKTGKEKVGRGGGAVPWVYDGMLDWGVHPFVRSASRYGFEPDADYLVILGFRVVLAPEVEVTGDAGGRSTALKSR